MTSEPLATDDIRDAWMRACYYLDNMYDNESGPYRAGGPAFDAWLEAHDRIERGE